MLFPVAGQLNDTQQELKENNELVVELQGIIFLAVFLVFQASIILTFVELKLNLLLNVMFLK